MFLVKYSLTKRGSFAAQYGFFSFRPHNLLFEEPHFAVIQMCSKTLFHKYQKTKAILTTLFSLFWKAFSGKIFWRCTPGLRQFLANGNPLQMMKNSLYFTLKALFPFPAIYIFVLSWKYLLKIFYSEVFAVQNMLLESNKTLFFLKEVRELIDKRGKSICK